MNCTTEKTSLLRSGSLQIDRFPGRVVIIRRHAEGAERNYILARIRGELIVSYPLLQYHTSLKPSSDQRGWVVWLGFLDSSWRVLPSLDIGVRCSCRGLDRRGPIVTRGGRGKPHWIYSAYEASCRY